MSATSRIAKNSLFMTIAYVVSTFFNFFFLAYTTRTLGTAGFGILSLALALTGIMGVFNDLGLSTILTRDVARERSKSSKYLQNITTLKTVLVLVTLCLVIITAMLLGYPEETFYVVVLIATSNAILNFSSMFNALFQAHEKMEYQAIGGILSSGLMIIGATYAFYNHFTVIQFSCIYVIANLIVLMYSIIICIWKFIPLKFGLDIKFSKEIIIQAWPMGVIALSMMLYTRLSTLMLEPMRGQVAVGLYNAAFRLSDMSIAVPVIFVSSVFPIISRYHHESISSFIYAYEKTFKYLLIVALLMALTVMLLASQIIQIVNGPGYEDAASVLIILIWSSVLIYQTCVLNTTLINANLQKICMYVILASIPINFGLNAILIPFASYNGAATSAVLTEAFIFTIELYYLNKFGYRINFKNTMAVPIAGFTVTGALAFILVIIGLNIFIITIASIIIYVIIIARFGLTIDDWSLIFSTVKPLAQKVLNINFNNQRVSK